jgi:carbon-monoxide dehydrogenase medium subunit
MVAAPFGYECVSSFEEAAQALQRRGEDAKVIAGGQSLVPMLNLRLARPAWLVDINPVGAGPIEDHGGYLRLPALTRHHAIEESDVVRRRCPILAEAAARVGNVRTRTRGTIGGSLAHADPAADWLVALTVLGAELNLAGPDRRRRLALSGFVEGAMQTVLKSNELITGVRLAKFSQSARFGYHKICRKVGEFADAIGAAAYDPECGVRRLAVSTLAGAPLVLEARLEAPGPVPEIARLEDDLRQAGFSGDAYETRLRAVVLQRATTAMAAR